ncbi:MAG: Dna2/Cas4 domain-containing protein [Anaerolineales bacterium]|jgi:CRISPR-associated exonuclease Cas4
MQYLAVILFLLALFLFWQSGRTRKTAGLPGGRVVYSDTNEWGRVEAPLFDPVTHLVGRPDYLIRRKDAVIPVEVKSGRVPDSPYDSHIYQLAAYCLLVEREFGVRPPYGAIHYGRRTFAIDYTQELETALLDLMAEMRVAERKKSVDRSHDSPPRCRGCGFAYTCEQAL